MDDDRNPAKRPVRDSDGPRQLSLLDLAEPLTPGSLKDEREFVEELTGLLKIPATIVLTKNRSTIISVKPQKNGEVVARVQHAFRAADRQTMKALAQFIKNPTKRSRELIDEFMREHASLLEALAREAPAAAPARARGRSHDLTKVLTKVKREHGLAVTGVSIGWSTRGRRTKRRRSIKFGSYCRKSKTIRVHPDLDSESVPAYFVEYIVYHELLHAVFPPSQSKSGRREIHSKEFLRFERKFNNYEQALAFEEQFVKRWLS